MPVTTTSGRCGRSHVQIQWQEKTVRRSLPCKTVPKTSYWRHLERDTGVESMNKQVKVLAVISSPIWQWKTGSGNQLPRCCFSWARLRRADFTSGANAANGSAVWMNGCYSTVSNESFTRKEELAFSKSKAEARFSGSTFRARFRKSLKTELRICSSFIFGVPFVAIR